MIQIEHPLEQIAESLYHALACGLPDIQYEWRGKHHKRRPTTHDVTLQAWPQLWGDTATAFDRHKDMLAGAAMTSDMTVVIRMQDIITAVYVGGKPAYAIDHRKALDTHINALEQDILARSMAGQRESVEKYGSILPELE